MNQSNTNQLVENVIYSFQLAKRDIYSFGARISALNHNLNSFTNVQNSIIRDLRMLKQENLQLRALIQQLTQKLKKRTVKNKKTMKIKTVAKTITRKKPASKPKRRFVASTTGNKVHVLSCIFAKNIRPKRKLYFASKTRPLNHGFKACECVKRI